MTLRVQVKEDMTDSLQNDAKDQRRAALDPSDIRRFFNTSRFRLVDQLTRKRFLFLYRLTPRKLANLALLSVAYLLRLRRTFGVPAHLKIDVAPSCQLRCPSCLHGIAKEYPGFKSQAGMSLDLFKRIVDQVAGRALVMALYHMGEPLLQRRLPEMISYADNHGINTYFTTNLSLKLSDDRILEFLSSGLTMLVVALDGITPQTFGRERVGGDWSLVKSKMERIARLRASLGHGPKLIIQLIVFDFNQHEREFIRDFVRQVGFDDVYFVEGIATHWRVARQPVAKWKPRRARALPHCAWPYFSMLVNSEGHVSGCCLHRIDEHHTGHQTARNMGNVAVETLSGVYNNESYRVARSMSSNPIQAKNVAGNFCEDCAQLSD